MTGLHEELMDLETHITDRGFKDRAKAFEQALRETTGLARADRDALWQRYQTIWEKRKEWAAKRREQGEQKKATLTAALDALAAIAQSPAFPNQAKVFAQQLKDAPELSRDDHDSLWQRLQDLWDDHKGWSDQHRQQSAIVKQRYTDEIRSLDYTYDGLPIDQTFSNFARVGHKVREAREQLKAIRERVNNDPELTPSDRHAVYNLINTTWDKVRQSEELTFQVHAERADELYNQAHDALESLPTREASAILKAHTAELRALWLPKDDRDKYRRWFDKLWDDLKYKREAGQQEWVARIRERLDRLNSARDKAIAARERVQDNIDQNEDRVYSARSDEYRDRVQGWIEDGENKKRDIEASIEDLDAKIRNLEERLNRS